VKNLRQGTWHPGEIVTWDFLSMKQGCKLTVQCNFISFFEKAFHSKISSWYKIELLKQSDKLHNSIALMVEAVHTSEMLVCFSETTRRCITEGCHLLARQCFINWLHCTGDFPALILTVIISLVLSYPIILLVV
jgi:hypothetical protein